MGEVPGLVAGAARVALPTRPGTPLMGYALRTGPSRGEIDPLHARAVYLRSGGDLLVVALDLCLVAPSQAAGVRARLAERTSVPLERIVVTCIHTHSGPDTGLGALMAGRLAPAYVEPLLSAAVDAGARAVASAEPARIGFGSVPLAIGRNRRRLGGPLDPAARIVRIDRASGEPLAVVWLHGCHPTVLGHENLAFSADWPGAAAAAIEEAYPGALSLFLLSAHADVDPRTRGLQDLARANRSLGAAPEVMAALGREAGTAVADAAACLATGSDVRVGAASVRVPIPVHGGVDDLAASEALGRRRQEALAAVGLAPDTNVRTSELHRLADACVAELPADEARERVARVRLYLRDRSAPVFAGGRVGQVEVQAVRIGDAQWLGLPLEATARVGLAWTARSGSPAAAVLSIANGWMRYLPHPDDFGEPNGHQGYEVLTSTFVPEAAQRLLDAGEDLLSRV